MIKSVCFLYAFLLPSFCFAKIYVNIGIPQGVQASSLAISARFIKKDKTHVIKSRILKHKLIAHEIEKRLKKNLKFSGYFYMLSPQAFIEDVQKVGAQAWPKDLQGFRWANWQAIGASFLLFVDYSVVKNHIKIKAFLHHVHLKKTILQKEYQARLSQENQIIDQLSDDIIFQLSKKKSIFRTKITSLRNLKNNRKELFYMSWDGSKNKRLSYHRSFVVSPQWSPDGSKISYSVFVYNKKFKQQQLALFMYDFKKHKTKLISARQGINLSSGFFPDGKSLLLTLNLGIGQMDIFKLHLKSQLINPLTRGPRGSINVEAKSHPITKKIVFSSDKSGKTMIYTMDPSGARVKQLSFAGHHNSTPSWNPIKNEIVFSGLSKGRMDLFLISANGQGLKRLTHLKKAQGQWANNESPSWSPDGRFIVFSSNVSGTYQLYIMNIEKLSIQRITFDSYNYTSPSWSPYLQ